MKCAWWSSGQLPTFFMAWAHILKDTMLFFKHFSYEFDEK